VSIIYINPYQFAVAAPTDLWTPAAISTNLWLDASDASTFYDATTDGNLVAAEDTVARWQDKSGNSRHFIQGDASLRPTFKASVQNGKSVLRFDGSDWMEGPGFASWANQALFFISCKTTTSDTLFSLFGNTSRTSFYYLAQSGNASAQANNDARVNGILATWTTRGQYWSAIAKDESLMAMLPIISFSATSTNDKITMPYSNFNLPMDCNEIVLVPDTISATVRDQIEGYLAHKWGTAGSLPANHPYKNAAPTL